MTSPPPYRGGCTPGMRRRPDGQGCRRDCLHRVLVDEYRDARHAWEERRESSEPVPAHLAFGSQAAFYQLEDGDYRAAYPPPTFKAWLVDNANRRSDPT